MLLVHGGFGKIKLNSKTSFWNKKKIFITGHTGFKGSWLCILLNMLGAKIYGYSLSIEKNSLYRKANANKLLVKSYLGDIKNLSNLQKKLIEADPQIVFHLAAQPLVISSYVDPVDTFNVNTIGTLNLLEAIKKLKNLKCAIIVTTDKVYQIIQKKTYKETDALGASDPYGTSKACAEMIVECYNLSFFDKKKYPIISTARAGNVIGGGDFSKFRIVPDYLKALNIKKQLIIRNPKSIRPWQHVLEPLSGYLQLAKKTYNANKHLKQQSYNFGPKLGSSVSVESLIKLFQKESQNKIKVLSFSDKKKFNETKVLKLSSFLSQRYLGWRQRYNLQQTIKDILQWNSYVKVNKKDYLGACKKTIANYYKWKK